MLALYDDERRTLLRVGTMLAVGGCAVLPFTFSPASVAADAGQTLQRALRAAPAVPGRLVFPEIAIAKDPFMPDGTSHMGMPIVRAIVTGEAPRALLDLGGAVQVLGIGDKLGAQTIIEIDAKGVQLSGGARLVLPGQP